MDLVYSSGVHAYPMPHNCPHQHLAKSQSLIKHACYSVNIGTANVIKICADLFSHHTKHSRSASKMKKKNERTNTHTQRNEAVREDFVSNDSSIKPHVSLIRQLIACLSYDAVFLTVDVGEMVCSCCC